MMVIYKGDYQREKDKKDTSKFNFNLENSPRRKIKKSGKSSTLPDLFSMQNLPKLVKLIISRKKKKKLNKLQFK
ncbi:hypothetical protein AQUCO_02300221v1 [Aquilegia coerulea]|uniref:Uncharacterized protein n=1 Tax=Aquilegia coerulea TaxID=218851 RepID=A0A2G5DCP2_AQUCA|nr:hypothetical protein AQUCO_02300221v1 [Aquilegia coerulea]